MTVTAEDEESRCGWCEEPLGADGIHYEPEATDEPAADYCSINCWLAAQ